MTARTARLTAMIVDIPIVGDTAGAPTRLALYPAASDLACETCGASSEHTGREVPGWVDDEAGVWECVPCVERRLADGTYRLVLAKGTVR